ncbi:acyl-CoA dehydrogenase family protein [Phenylobacterium sp.]|uniref:acyl-CoA dehydrogenase family protein n=1 Tax=Phenylobacterium sp. TaxID=1871053 RepID=UPI002FDF5776
MDLLADQFSRLLDSLPTDNPWPTLEASGFLDLLKPETDGGAGLPLEALFPLALELGGRPEPPPILREIAARAPGDPTRALWATLAAGEMAGAMLAIQALTVEYALTRKQFGREIGRFQAVQHQIAVMAQEVLAARMAAQAAFLGPAPEVSEHRAGVAKLRCCQAARSVSAIAHAVHGAIGVSEEYALHPLTRRLRQLALAHGGEGWWAARLGAWALSESSDLTTLARKL